MADELWCQIRIVGPDHSVLSHRRLQGPGAPDLGVVDEIARLLLVTGRIGGHIVLTEVAPAVGALLELAGLRVEVEGQREGGEEAFWIQQGQEELQAGDLPGRDLENLYRPR
jgi:hypothetical protein